MTTTDAAIVVALLCAVAVGSVVAWDSFTRKRCTRLGHPLAWREDFPGGGPPETSLRCACGKNRRSN